MLPEFILILLKKMWFSGDWWGGTPPPKYVPDYKYYSTKMAYVKSVFQYCILISLAILWGCLHPRNGFVRHILNFSILNFAFQQQQLRSKRGRSRVGKGGGNCFCTCKSRKEKAKERKKERGLGYGKLMDWESQRVKLGHAERDIGVVFVVRSYNSRNFVHAK